MRLFDQDQGTHLKLLCLFIDSLYASTSGSPGLPLQCFFQNQGAFLSFPKCFLLIFYVTDIKKIFFIEHFTAFLVFFFRISRFILPPSKRPPPLPEDPNGKSIQMNNSH